jgi:hypothetical protein
MSSPGPIGATFENTLGSEIFDGIDISISSESSSDSTEEETIVVYEDDAGEYDDPEDHEHDEFCSCHQHTKTVMSKIDSTQTISSVSKDGDSTRR